ncbi:Transforming protein RhoA [Nosema granulosis]|uniref:Transforming protein RhoA n=1 Tax=Nosema granulosis TaxID=83296 RepID=A0A9P6GZ70_9MICR|nr:Transforming protein RhoA [Nosema granulosis]
MTNAPIISKQLTLVGHGTCGKTSILNRHMNKRFDEIMDPTVFSSTTNEYKHEQGSIELRLWDTAGQDEFSRFRHLALPTADYILICFSVESRASYTEIKNSFIPLIKECCPTAKYFIAATKIDLREDRNVLERLVEAGDSPISRNEGLELAKTVGAVGYFECSAKQDKGIEEIFYQISKFALKENVKEEKSWFSKLFEIFDCCGKNS